MTILAMLRNWEWNTTKPEVRRRFRHLEETVTFRGHFLVAGALDRAKHFRMNENGPGSALDPTPDGRYASASVRRRKIVALLGTRTAIVMRRRSDRSSLRKRRVSP